MKLRDLIAIEVMKIHMTQAAQENGLHIVEDDEDEEEWLEQLSNSAYAMADAMMRVREEV